jgi:hypothetical protein
MLNDVKMNYSLSVPPTTKLKTFLERTVWWWWQTGMSLQLYAEFIRLVQKICKHVFSHNIMLYKPDNVAVMKAQNRTEYSILAIYISDTWTSQLKQQDTSCKWTIPGAIYSPFHQRETSPILEDKSEGGEEEIAICDEIAFCYTERRWKSLPPTSPFS